MMPPFPFFRFPNYFNSYRNPYYNNSKYYTHFSNPHGEHFKNYDNNDFHGNTHLESIPSHSNFSNDSKANKVESDSTRLSTEQFFDIFGIHLYFDDILILCLLFFLYQEEFNDQFLFIALLLLLLS